MAAQPLYKSLYLQVIVAIACGILLGYVAPEQGAAMQPLGDGFIKLVKMVIGPVVFVTVALGIAHTGAVRDVGRIGLRALVYFEGMSTLALVIGLVLVTTLEPGRHVGINLSALDTQSVSAYAEASKQLSVTEFILNIVPTTFVGAFTQGEITQVLLVSILVGLALLMLGERVRPLVHLLDQASAVCFAIVGLIMRLAPVGAFGAMAYTIGRYGIGTLLSLGELMADVYLACLFFVFVVLGLVTAAIGTNIWRVLVYIREEILIVLGTSSSESVLPRIMEKLERLGCDKSVVGLVVPTGYSFNLDGTSIYMSMAAMFVAQASGVHLSLGAEFSLMAILLLTSKGAAAVTGGGFIVLAATLAAFPSIPMTGLALLLGVDRFMSEARAITNLIGNTVATLVVARWEGTLDMTRVRRVLAGGRIDDDAVRPPLFVSPTYKESDKP
ncbi:MAG TPA: dicarboxylate/amino acid:cation symporter [Vicinamibacterales bacterium]|nr:dicarboxylate/amino acid:cation symporter [Vicinamibacterales bacterium]